MTTIRVSDSTKKRLDGYKEYMGLDSLDEAIVSLMDKQLTKYQFSAPEEYPDIPRKSLCPCGSGKKFKNCHGKE